MATCRSCTAADRAAREGTGVRNQVTTDSAARQAHPMRGFVLHISRYGRPKPHLRDAGRGFVRRIRGREAAGTFSHLAQLTRAWVRFAHTQCFRWADNPDGEGPKGTGIRLRKSCKRAAGAQGRLPQTEERSTVLYGRVRFAFKNILNISREGRRPTWGMEIRTSSLAKAVEGAIGALASHPLPCAS